MYSPRKHFSLYLGGGKLKYFRILVIIAVSIGEGLSGNTLVFAQTTDPGAQSVSTVPEEESFLLQREDAISIGEGSSNPSRKTGSFGMILQMVLVLALAAAAIYGVVFFLKRISRPQEQKDPYLKILAAAHLGSNRFVHVVSVGSKAWLIGASEGGVSLISEIEDPETVDAMLVEASRKTAEAGTGKLSDFAHLLNRFSGREHTPVQTNLNLNENIQKRLERLQKMSKNPRNS
ncbi:MAG: flagellar biosynthetic protein FliO [Treponema sp.]|jgi:flagellar protein FliO/FliZ|nr:flagellar biosynthetic protein FliO [Treponema sp.]